MLTLRQCETCLHCSIELWLRFAAFAVGALSRWRWPLTIEDADILARELYSGHVRRNGRLEIAAFIPSERNGFGISVNRWCKAPERLYKALAFNSANRRRGIQRFKGFARFPAASLKRIDTEDSLEHRAFGAPALRNPFHADIRFPADRGTDYYLLIASEFIKKVKPESTVYEA